MTFKAEDQVDGLRSGLLAETGAMRLAVWGLVLLSIAFVGAVIIWPERAIAFNQEGGLIETVSAAGLLVAGLAALWRYPGVARLYIGLTCLLLAERELEASFYQEDSVPFHILNSLDIALDITLVRIVLVCAVLGGVVWHGIPMGLRAFKQRTPFLMVFLAAGSIAVIAQLLEEFSGLNSVTLSVATETRLFVLEEMLEMFFSIGILAAVLIGWPKLQSDENIHDQDFRSCANIR
ncbi:hypothetical protein [uncultured Ruegeria sp.]|uniref:hypothetical protein n=1 Tax=uncultured Ruegeria sp. TaxID=259304 RepID=UPI00260B7F33|nr:hypothetical protein [uncultured Ruegeria sp.]